MSFGSVGDEPVAIGSVLCVDGLVLGMVGGLDRGPSFLAMGGRRPGPGATPAGLPVVAGMTLSFSASSGSRVGYLVVPIHVPPSGPIIPSVWTPRLHRFDPFPAGLVGHVRNRNVLTGSDWRMGTIGVGTDGNDDNADAGAVDTGVLDMADALEEDELSLWKLYKLLDGPACVRRNTNICVRDCESVYASDVAVEVKGSAMMH